MSFVLGGLLPGTKPLVSWGLLPGTKHLGIKHSLLSSINFLSMNTFKITVAFGIISQIIRIWSVDMLL